MTTTRAGALSNLLAGLLLLCLPLSCTAQARQQPRHKTGNASVDEQAEAKKLEFLHGRISPNGRTFTDAETKQKWSITDPKLVKAYEGKRVQLKAHVDPRHHAIAVVRVKPAEKRVNRRPAVQ